MRRIVAALAVVVLLGVSGCEDEPEDDGASPTTSPEPSVETSLTTSEPTPDPENETAREFIERWIDLSNAATATGDTGDLDAVTTPECRSCTDFVQSSTSMPPEASSARRVSGSPRSSATSVGSGT